MASCCTTASSIWVIASGVRCCACGSLDTVSSIRVRARIGEGRLSLPSPSPAYSTAPPFLYQGYRLWWILQLGGGTWGDLRRGALVQIYVLGVVYLEW